jgi:hypothetical protein
MDRLIILVHGELHDLLPGVIRLFGATTDPADHANKYRDHAGSRATDDQYIIAQNRPGDTQPKGKQRENCNARMDFGMIRVWHGVPRSKGYYTVRSRHYQKEYQRSDP